MKIYTRTGDSGETSLFGGKRVSKHDMQIESYGTVDELNSFLGLLISQCGDSEEQARLMKIQAILFDVGSHLASDGSAEKFLPALKDEHITDLEKAMDNMNQSLPTLQNFVLPGGNPRIAQAHVCRTVCRRAERRVAQLITEEAESLTWCLKFLNRLSDYLFVLARLLAKMDGVDEVKWNPK